MMQLGFNKVKNTVFLFVLVLISCGNFSDSKSEINDKEVASSHDSLSTDKLASNDNNIVVGANRTELYLPLLNDKKVGIVANQTSVIFKHEDNTHLVDSLVSLNVNLKKVFSPEHGFRGTADAGELVSDGVDIKTGLPIVSLHGKSKKPSKEQLQDIDIVIFDIQDVGVRFYTYISTLHYIMESCAEANIPLIVLDRPNPNGHYIDGPILEPEHKSFLGMHPIPLVHGMTIGEMAKMINGENWLNEGVQCGLTVIPIEHYTHETPYSLPIRPSPNLPNDQSIKLYPSLGLFEGTNINAGRGTEFQFQRYGAPFLNPETMIFTYTPESNFGAKHPKHKDKLCYGEDLAKEKINGMTLRWIIKAYENSIDKSKFFLTDGFTKHAGNTTLQKQIKAGLTEKEIKQTWDAGLKAYDTMRKPYLLYE